MREWASRGDRTPICGNVVAARSSARTAAAMNAPRYRPWSRIRRNAGFPPSASASAGEGYDPVDGVLAQHDLLAEPRAFVSGLQAAGALAVGEPPRRGGVGRR